jgi:hypothetical protein
VGIQRSRLSERHFPIAGFAYHLEVILVREKPGQALAKQGVVIHEQQAAWLSGSHD